MGSSVASKHHGCRQSSAAETDSEKQAAGTTRYTEAELLQTRLSKCLCSMAKKSIWLLDGGSEYIGVSEPPIPTP